MENGDITFGIILRAYNCRDVMSKAVDSVVNQKYCNWKLYIVDDGSNDGTYETAESYVTLDNRITVIHQSNRGCVLATMVGIEASSEDYICILDADDEYDTRYLSSAYKCLSKYDCDIIMNGISIIDEKGQEINGYQMSDSLQLLNRVEAIRILFNKRIFGFNSKIVKRERICHNSRERHWFETLGKDLNWNEDMYLFIPILLGSDNVAAMDNCLYKYTDMKSSVSHGKKTMIQEYYIFRTMEYLKESFRDRKLYTEEVANILRKECINQAMALLPKAINPLKYEFRKRKEMKNIPYYREMKKRFKVEYVKDYGLRKKLYFFFFLVVA